MIPTRFEHTQENTGIQADSENRAAKSDAFSTNNLEISPDLSRVIEAWPALPDHIRAAILALVGTAN
jgi:hypothetical protein